MLLRIALLLLFVSPLAAQERSARFEMDERKEHHAVLTRCLTWLTGASEDNAYVSVGRLANYFGFVHFRITSGHSIHRASLGAEVLSVLPPGSESSFFELLDAQRATLRETREARMRINALLEEMLEGQEHDREELLLLGRDFGRLEAQLGAQSAETYSKIFLGLDQETRDGLKRLRESAESRNPGGKDRVKASRPLRKRLKKLPQEDGQEFWSLVSRFLSWTTGTPDANDFDTAGKPSQHFGFASLRVETGHAVQRSGVAKAVLEILNDEQAERIEDVIHQNRASFDAFFAARRSINRELERGWVGDEIRMEEVVRFGQAQGEAEAEMTWRQAMGLLDVRDALSREQVLDLIDLRDRYLDLPTAEEVAADPVAAGRRLFKICALCHVPQSEGRALGPRLNGVLERPVASLESFEYSPAMRKHGGDGRRWSAEELDKFLADPRDRVPGTMMGFRGMPDADLRLSLIQFLQSLGQADGDDVPAPEPKQEK